MIYSVWNQGRGVYDYYQTPDLQAEANAPRPAHLSARQLGIPAAQAAWRLPTGAKRIGSGEYARGRVATTSPAAMGFFGIEEFFDPKFIAIGLAVFLYWRWRKGK